MHAHAHADNAPLLRTCNARVCYGVVQCLPAVGIYGERKTIAWCPCTSPSTLEMFCEKISASPGSSKEIAGLLRKMMMIMMMMMMMMKMTPRMSGFSRGKLEAGRIELGLCTARYESKSCC